MTKRINNIVIIEPEPDSKCSDCGKIAECRPYGKNGASVCFDCGMKNPDIAVDRMSQRLFGEDLKIEKVSYASKVYR